MQPPENLEHLIDATPFGRVSIDIHRAYGTTQMVKARARQQHKTPTVEAAGSLIGEALGEVLRLEQSGHLEVEISFKQGRLQFTILEAFID